MTRRVTVRDGYGTPHSGPRGAWWLPVRDGSNEFGIRPRSELPTFRLRAWNVAAVVYAAAAVVLASRLGELVPFLAILGALVAVACVGLWWLTATLPARYARQIGQPVPVKAQPTSTPAQGAGVRPEPVAEGVR